MIIYTQDAVEIFDVGGGGRNTKNTLKFRQSQQLKKKKRVSRSRTVEEEGRSFFQRGQEAARYADHAVEGVAAKEKIHRRFVSCIPLRMELPEKEAGGRRKGVASDREEVTTGKRRRKNPPNVGGGRERSLEEEGSATKDSSPKNA